MAERKHVRGLTVTHHHGVAQIDIGSMQIWDGADLSLIRDTLAKLMRGKVHRAIILNMSKVQFVPSGFFGLLSDCADTGISICLLAPHPSIRDLLWFQRFFIREAGHPVSYAFRDAPSMRDGDLNEVTRPESGGRSRNMPIVP